MENLKYLNWSEKNTEPGLENLKASNKFKKLAKIYFSCMCGDTESNAIVPCPTCGTETVFPIIRFSSRLHST